MIKIITNTICNSAQSGPIVPIEQLDDRDY